MRKGELSKGKSKTTAVVLAVLFSQWTWVYTYRDNAGKFWTGLLLNIFLCWTYVVPICIFIWAIIDNATADKEYFKNYWK